MIQYLLTLSNSEHNRHGQHETGKNISKSPRQRQRERCRTKSSMSRTNGCARAFFVHFLAVLSTTTRNYQLSSAYFGKRERTAANFSYFHLELNASVMHLVWASSETNRLLNRSSQLRNSKIKYKFSFN